MSSIGVRAIQPSSTASGDSAQPGKARASEKLRVLMLDAAGSSVPVTHNLANYLARLGCDIHVFTAPHWRRAVGGHDGAAYQTEVVFYQATQFRSYEAHSIAATFFWKVIRLLQHAAAMLAICFKARQFDLVHTQILPLPLMDYLFLRVMSRHTPVVCTVHELVPHECWLRRLNRRALRGIYRRARVLFVFTAFTRSRLIGDLGISARKIVTVPLGNLEHMLAFRTSPSPKKEIPIILFIGEIRRDKGLETLIHAARHLRNKIPEFKVVVAGRAGFDLSPIRTLTTKLQLDDLVDFHVGYLPEAEFAAYLSQATVVALPYRRIEQSGVAIAACTFGKAVVATRCGGVEELVNAAGNGLLVPIGDPEQFAEALAIVLSDDRKRKTFEACSTTYARQTLSWAPIAAQTVAAYKQVLTEFQ